jgi:hypothetical protein
VATGEHRPDVPLIDRVKIQAEVLIPLIKGLEEELGKERAHELVRSAVGEFYRDMAKGLTAERGSIGALMAFGEISAGGNAIDMEVRETTSEEELALDITGCRYAQFFQQIGEPELGFLLVCSSDFPAIEGVPGVELRRTQTIMQGADFCDFRYRFLPDELTEPPAS